MNTPISPGSPGRQLFAPGESASSSTATVSNDKGIANLDVRKFYDEVLKIASQFTQTAAVGGGKPLADSIGAPRIDSPSESFSSDDLTDLLRSMRTKNQDGQLRAAAEGIAAAKTQAKNNTDEQLGKIKEWTDKCKDAQSKGTLGKIFGWVGKIFAAVAAIAMVAVAAAATVATGGAAAPLLAIAIIGAVSATMSLASAISQEFGGPAISIGNLIQQTVGKFLTEVCGVDPKEAENISRIVGGVVGIATLAVLVEPSLMGNMVQGIALLAGADEKTAGYIGMAVTIAATVAIGIGMAVATGGTSTAATVAEVSTQVMVQTMKAVNTGIAASSAIVSGGTQIAAGGLTISKAISQEGAQSAIADKKQLAADMIKLQQQMEDDREAMKKVIEQIDESTQMVSKMISDTADSISQVTMNMSGKATV